MASAILLAIFLLIGRIPPSNAASTVTAGISRTCSLGALGAQQATPNNQVQYLYCLMLGRAADPSGLSFYTTQLTQKKTSMANLITVFYNSNEFATHFNTAHLAQSQFVSLLNNLLLFNPPSAQQLNSNTAQLANGSLSRTSLFSSMIASQQFINLNIILFAVDPSTLQYKMLFGYQGWFTAIQDKDPYSSLANSDAHWANWGTGMMSPSNATVDMWPDTASYPATSLYPTNFKLQNGATAQVYSAWDSATVDLHFQWMQQYGLDGAVVQEFVQGYLDASSQQQSETDQVALNVMASAEKYGRVFSVELDCSGCVTGTALNSVETRWMRLVDALKLTQSPAYLQEKGLPVVTLFGLGFSSNNVTPAEAAEIVNWFHSGAAPKYRATIVAQTCVGWRTLGEGCLTDTGWNAIYKSFDVIQPWYVGAWTSLSGADSNWNYFIKGDIDETKANGQGYMPTLWPGTSVSNLMRLRGLSAGHPINQVPRLGGQFWWHQLYNYLGNDPLHRITMAYGAMFDEVDEGTAMYKLAPTLSGVPQQAPAQFVYLDMPDSNSPKGYNLPSDWYLDLAGCGTQALHGVFVPTNTIPAAAAVPGCGRAGAAK